MSRELVALLNGQEVGRMHRDARGRFSFSYDNDWRLTKKAFPVSLSMPLAVQEHGHLVVNAFLWGLLPDNEKILDRWAQKFRVSARNPFALIAHVGEDCAGAIQFVRPERVEACRRGAAEAVQWLDEHGIAERLRLLRADQSAWRAGSDTGQFSLAGAQAKTALLFEEGKWGVPSGRVPTTHILKPPAASMDGHAENEHFCLGLARRLGIPTATSKVQRFEGEIAIVIERYDRLRTRDGLVRVHQEDICQALSILPTRKYENEGGPSARTVIDLLRAHSGRREEDVTTFIDALVFNWLIGGTDAHAKNYSLLIGEGGRIRLAPLYDLASALAYGSLQFQKLKLAMRIGKDYRLRDINSSEWRKFAKLVQFDPDLLIKRIRSMADQIAKESSSVRDEIRGQGLDHDIVERLHRRLRERAEKVNASIG